jgi:N-acetylglutamate synthase-like GNAT family acetyltransferase
MLDVRPLTAAEGEALRAYLREDIWTHAYLLGILSWYGNAGPRARFTGAFEAGRLVGVLAEAREVHCWYASLGANDTAVAAALGRRLAVPKVEVLTGRADLVEAAIAALPAARVRRTTAMVIGVSHDDMPSEAPAHPVRRATAGDLPALVDLYEPYEFDGYPTRRHVWRALAERLRRSTVYVLELDGRPVAARRIEASSPEVALLGGLTVDPRYRGRRLARDMRLACVADLRRQGVPHCGLHHVDNPHLGGNEHREHAPWTVANLAVPPPPPWRDFLRRVRARLSPWDRPCRRRRPDFTLR